MLKENTHISGILLFLLIGLCCFTACDDESGGQVVRSNLQEFTPQQNQEIGAAINEYITGNPQLYPQLDRSNHSDVYAYLDQLFNMLAYTSPVKNRIYFDWRITVLKDDSQTAAFSAPGGYLYIYTGLLRLLESESELLSLLGHEMSYIDEGIVTEALKDEFGGFVLADIILENEVPLIGDMADYLPTVMPSEEMVMQADSFSIALICPFNYEASSMKRFLENLRKNEMAHQVDWLKLRPGDLVDRIDQIEINAQPCGITDGRFVERYLNFRSKLP